MSATHLAHHFLLAMPALKNPHFFHALIYICEHDDDGTMGIVLNRITEYRVGELFGQLGIRDADKNTKERLLLAGGPMQAERGFILHRPSGDWEASLTVQDDVTLTSSRDILEVIAQGKGPAENIIALGYAGWSPGQLEQEIADSAWLTMPADSDMIFNTPPDKLWQSAAHAMGVDLNLLSSQTGHA